MCDYAVVELNLDFIKTLLIKVQSIHEESHGFAYYTIKYPFRCEFYQEGEDSTIEEEFINQQETVYQLLDEEWNFREVEDLDTLHCIKMMLDGDFWFEAHGKHSNVLYNTEIINLYEIEQTIRGKSKDSN